MANRAYLYAKKGNKVTGISEYNYDIPISHKILVSQNVKTVRSKIFRSPFKIAIQGDFKKGIEKLYTFLEELKSKEYFGENVLNEYIEETKAFLEENNDYEHFHLECGELFGYNMYFKNRKLFKEIWNIDKVIEEFYNIIDEMKKGGNKDKEERMINLLGIREWSEYLYYEI